MVTEKQILLFLHNDSWFVPSKSNLTKIITDDNGNKIEVAQSYYHNYSDGEQISIRVSEHGTSLNTWIKRRTNPTQSLQNLSVVFSHDPVMSLTKTEPIQQIDDHGNIVTKHLYFVIEQYSYKLGNISLNDFKKIIKRLKNLNLDNVFTDPFKKKPSKVANRKVLTPTDIDGNKIKSTTNPVHPRQTIVASNPDKEVDAKGNIIAEKKSVVITETMLRSIIHETIRKIIAQP